jgi:predicted nucleic acid-binding protein
LRRALLDTSVFVARELGRTIRDPDPEPEEVAVSVITLGELERGVLLARDEGIRALRMETLISAREEAVGLTVDQRVASAYARLTSERRRAGASARGNDVWIAATALAHRVPLITQDADFQQYRDLEVVLV